MIESRNGCQPITELYDIYKMAAPAIKWWVKQNGCPQWTGGVGLLCQMYFRVTWGRGGLFLPANHNRPCDFWGKWLLRLVGGSGPSGRSCRRGTCQSRPCSPWAVGVRAGPQLGGLGWPVPHTWGPQSSPQTGGTEPTLWPGQHWGRPWPGRKPLVPMLGLCGTFVSWPEGCSRWGLPS